MKSRIYCLMWSGNPLTPQIYEALFINALDMWQNGKHKQFIKAPKYDGVIETNLETIDYLGEAAISFEAMVSNQEWEGTQVRFVVHVDALEKAEEFMWGGMMAISPEMDEPPPPPPPMNQQRSKYNINPSMN